MVAELVQPPFIFTHWACVAVASRVMALWMCGWVMGKRVGRWKRVGWVAPHCAAP